MHFKYKKSLLATALSKLSGVFYTNQAIASMSKVEEEILHANIFHDTVKGSKWFINQNVTPSGWAINYYGLCTLYNILEKAQPQNVLEFGLGQSSKLIHQYAAYFENVHALTYENNKNWIKFFKKGLNGEYNINIHCSELEEIQYNGQRTIAYSNGCEELRGQKFDFVLVDGPVGSCRYSRSQILKLVPDCLANSFCVFLDDTERPGEKETEMELCRLLEKANIDYCCKCFSSIKSHSVICSPDLSFITTM